MNVDSRGCEIHPVLVRFAHPVVDVQHSDTLAVNGNLDLLASRGVSTVGYHFNPVTGWLVRPDGTVVYRAEQWS